MPFRKLSRSIRRSGSWLALGLLVAFLAAACASAAPTESAPVSVDSAPATEAAAPDSAPTAAALTEAPVVELPPFVPRGDNLEATDPTTVSLANGGLQLIEFFRFT